VAAEACYIELEKLGMPIGKQDQYASAFGGLNLFQFGSDGVAVEPISLGAETWQTLQRNLLLFFTGSARHSTEILSKQSRSSAQEDPRVLAALHNVKTMTAQVKACLVKGDLDGFGELLHHNWQEKKRFAPGITNVRIDEAYHAACQHGALGGKITGAGGGGFLMLYCREQYQDAVTSALSRLGLQRMDFRFEQTGAQVLMNSGLRLNSLATYLGHRQLHHRE
jgi:D-glycero-alpha-D-manno-heptose-7-phosphate kinase